MTRSGGDRWRAAAEASAARRPVVAPVPDGELRPFWSVMVPTYDGGDRLARALESVLVQDPGPAEMQIEVVDDASPHEDPTDTVRRVAGDRVQVWRQPTNVGAPANFTTCVRRSVGRWVHVLHADDAVLPGFYDRYRRRIEAQDEPPAMVVGRCLYVDDDERVLYESAPVITDEDRVVNPEVAIAAQHPFAFASVVVARSAYERLGGFDPRLVHANDWEMWARVAGSGRVVIVDEPLSLYRQHAASDTARLRRSTTYLDDALAAADVICARIDDPQLGADLRRANRRQQGALALEVARAAWRAGDRGNAARNAWRGARLRLGG
ncbi:MAG: glycosyltransferase [Acidimicrobiales bacterium]